MPRVQHRARGRLALLRHLRADDGRRADWRVRRDAHGRAARLRRVAKRGARPARGAKAPARRGGKSGRGRSGGIVRRIAVALALVGLGAGGLAAAAWIGLVPGVQLRQRVTPTDERVGEPSSLVGDVASDERAPEPAAPDVPATDPTQLADATTTSTGEEADDPSSPLSASDLVAGDALYRGAGRCAGCHGSAGEGVARLGPSLVDDSWLHGSSRAAIRRVVAEGAAPPLGGYAVAMPAYGAQLGLDQLTQLATYVWALSHPDAVRADSAAARPTVPVVSPSAPATPPPRPTVPAP